MMKVALMPKRRFSSTPANRVIQDLVETVDRLWKRDGDAPEAFSSIAQEALQDRDTLHRLPLSTLEEWMVQDPGNLRAYFDAETGARHVATFYWGPRFIVDLSYRAAPWTAIHNHACHGAFGILEGTALYALYDFEGHERFGQLEVGELRLNQIRILRPGLVESVEAGTGFLHQACTLSGPLLLLSVRTRRIRGVREYRYIPPALAAPVVRGQAHHRRSRLLESLLTWGHPSANELFERIALRANDAELLDTLESAYDTCRDLSRIRALLGRLPHPRPWFPAWERALQRRRETAGCGAWSTGPEGRFLSQLAVLRPDAAQRDGVIRQFIDGRDPADVIVSCLKDPQSPVRLNETAEFVLRRLLEGHNDREICRALSRSFSVEEDVSLQNDVADCIGRLRRVPVLASLLGSKP